VLWRRHGRILAPPMRPSGVWHTHCQAPILHHLSGTRWRLYFAGRDERNRSHGFRAEIGLGSGVERVECHLAPVLIPGEPGAFDADGAMPGSILVRGSEIWLYYTGWSVRRDVPFQTAIGLAISDDGGLTFEKAAPGPVLGQGIHDAFSALAPLVLDIDGIVRMFYASVVSWQDWQGRLEPRYALKSAGSYDGIHWVTSDAFALDFASESEGGLSRPSILRHGGALHMWYSHRGWQDYRTRAATSYRFGYATSEDGNQWRRRDDEIAFVNPPRPDDWDGLMQAYPAVVRVADQLFCFYSGNGFGQGGIGYATLEGGIAVLASQAARTPIT
jgi:hypothetical protein